MARQVQPAEVTSFVKGLITEASPLTFPEQASLDEVNFVLNTDGSRQRRLGFDLEDGFQEAATGNQDTSKELAFSSYLWENAGGDSNKKLIVVQTGSRLSFFDADSAPYSANVLEISSFPSDSSTQVFSYAVVDGDLVVASGNQFIRRFSYENGSVTNENYRLTVRDTFGVEETNWDGETLTGEGVDKRPSGLSDTHKYNLRNQTWAVPRRARADGYKRSSVDTIEAFRDRHGSRFPSNADAVTYALGAWLEDSETEESFLPDELVGNPPGNYRAPSGHFIIDLLNRGASRIDNMRSLYQKYSSLIYPLSSLRTDSTPGGPTCIAEYAGRVWYAGFSGEVEDGDSRSPRLSSYVFYSQLVTDPSKIPLCYQEGDPTSSETPDLVDTDGGFIRIDSAYGIKALVSTGSGILVVAENGVWMISGGSDYGFSATNNMRRKITDRGAIGSGSIVVLDKGIAYWAQDGIYQIGPDQFGDYNATNMTQTTIQAFYDDIPSEDKRYCQGIWDSYDQKIRWVYGNRILSEGGAKELVLDVPLGAFYPSSISPLADQTYPRVVSPVKVPPFEVTTQELEVTYGGETVTYDGEDVFTEIEVLSDSGFRESYYVCITSLSPLLFSFGAYRDTGFRDWRSVDGVGVDAKAYLLTGYLSGGDFLRKKDVPYVQFYLRKTETGFYSDEDGNLYPEGESSCLVRSQWSWTNSAAGNKWGRPFQAYRHRRLYSPSGASDTFDDGNAVVKTRSKLRGGGNVVSLLIETEEDKDLQLLGWSMVMGIGNGY